MQVKKAYYSIREVCDQTGLEPHVLRYWESEFPQLRPKKNRAGNRAYREKDIQVVQFIKHLLYQEQYTISGAKKKLAELRSNNLPLELASLTSEPEAPVAASSPDSVPAPSPEAVAAPAAQDNGKARVIHEAVQELQDLLRELQG